MISTGNDIIALKAINIARTLQPNFYKKILSISEKELYDKQFSGSINLEIFVWLLWSIKESAYKYLQRMTPGLVFSPPRVLVTQLTSPGAALTFENELLGRDFKDEPVYMARVSFGGSNLYSRSLISDTFICSVVGGSENFENTLWGIRLIGSSDGEHQSAAARAFLMGGLQSLLPNEDLHIGKSAHGYPVVFSGATESGTPVSLAHHGSYVAYSFLAR